MTDEMLPAPWGFSELIAHAIAAAPASQVTGIKIERVVDGKPKQWLVDLTPGPQKEKADGVAPDFVKRIPGRLANGDTVVVPLRSPADGEAGNWRKDGIFVFASGRGLGERAFYKDLPEQKPYTLCEVLMHCYADSRMIIPNPDLSHLTIHRLKENGTGEEEIVVDLAKSFSEKSDAPNRPCGRKTFAHSMPTLLSSGET